MRTRALVIVTASNTAGHVSADSAQVGPVAPSGAQIKALLFTTLVPGGKAAKIAAILKAGGYTITFKALIAGKGQISWYLVPQGAHLTKGKPPKPVLVATGKLASTKALTGKLKIKLTGAGRRLLKHAKSIRLTAKASFTPTGNAAVSTTKKFTLRG